MDLRDLHYFEAIAELEHVGRAAERLHRSQPALTNTLRRLERQSGGPLVERSGRGIRLTAAGRVLHALAIRMRLSMRDAEAELKAAVSGLSGEVRVGFVPSAAQFLLPQAIHGIHEQMPDVLLRSEVGVFESLDAKLRSGELDFIVVGARHPEPGIVSRTLLDDVVVPAAAASHPIFSINAPAVADLARFRWILQPPAFPHRAWVEEVFRQAGLARPHVQIETNMLNLQPRLVAMSGLLTALPRLQVQDDGLLREIAIPGVVMQRRLEVRLRTDSYLSAPAERLIELLRKA